MKYPRLNFSHLFAGPSFSTDVNHKNQLFGIFDIFFLLFIIIGNAAFLHFNAFRYFHFYDMCFGLDGGWRILNGQKPYIDFIYFSGPVYLYMNAFFFKLFGFGKNAVWIHLVVVHSIIIFLTYAMARRHIPRYLTWLVTILSTSSFYWTVSFPWHDQSAHLWGILGIVFLVCRVPWETPKKALVMGGFLSSMAVLSLMTKINIGVAYGVVFFLFCSCVSQRKKALIGYFLGLVLMGGVMFLLIGDIRACLKQILIYGMMTSDQRLSGFLHISQWVVNYYWIPLLIVLGNLWPYYSKFREWVVLLLGVFFVAIVSIISGQMIPSGNICLWGIFMTVALGLFYKIPYTNQSRWRRITYNLSKGILVIITLFFITLSVRYGVSLQTWKYITGKTPVGEYPLVSESMKGWKCDAFKGRVLDELVLYFHKKIPKEQLLLVLTDLQILYALTGHDSYRGIPIFVFRENHMPVPGEQLEEVKEHLQHNLPEWIVTDMDTYTVEVPYLGFKETMDKHYTVDVNLGYYALFKKIR